jgi:hypothetical protein
VPGAVRLTPRTGRWIGDVFGDRALADELRALEDQHRARPRAETIAEIIEAVRDRYDVVDESEPETGPETATSTAA